MLTLASGETDPATIATAVRQLVQWSAGVLTNERNAKTGAYSVLNSDKGETLALGGSAYYALTFNAPSGYDSDFMVMVVNEDSVRAKSIVLSGGATFNLYPLQTVIVFNQNNVWQVQGKARWRLPSGTTTIYVNQSVGNDSNDGLASGAGNAMATVDAAMTRIGKDIDVAGNAVLVQMGANETGTGVHIGANGFFIGTGGGAAITLDGGGFTLDGGGNPAIFLFFAYGFLIQNITLKGASCINLDHAMCRVGDGVVWGAVSSHFCLVGNGSKLEVNGTTTISASPGGLLLSVFSGSVAVFASSITFSTNVTWGFAGVLAKLGGIADFSGASFVLGGHTVTGQRWEADSNGIVFSASGVPNTFFPGSVNGTTSTGGQAI